MMSELGLKKIIKDAVDKYHVLDDVFIMSYCFDKGYKINRESFFKLFKIIDNEYKESLPGNEYEYLKRNEWHVKL